MLCICALIINLRGIDNQLVHVALNVLLNLLRHRTIQRIRKPVPGQVPTLTCRSVFWLRRRRRPVVSYEKLAMQGMGLQDTSRRFKAMSGSKRSHMAGNSYNAFSLCAMFLGQMICMGNLV